MIRELSALYSISEICEALNVSRSGYHAAEQRQKEPSQREVHNEHLYEQIERVYRENHRCYGSPRVTRQLRLQGETCSENRVARLMRQKGLKAKTKKAFRPRTTIRAREELVAPNHLAKLPIEAIAGVDQVWVSDITYVPTAEGWLYLAALMDLKSRKIVGWALEDHMNTSLIEKTLERAFQRRQPPPGLFLHSDRGSQYTSRCWARRLKSLKIRPSMGAIGYCYDNATMEAFWSTLKTEALPETGRFASKSNAKTELFYYIEVFYNRKRLHSSLDYRSPEEFEQQLYQSANN